MNALLTLLDDWSSPAYSADPEEVFSWVGVIMYLPPGQTEQQRDAITRRFEEYKDLMAPLLAKYRAAVRIALSLPAYPYPDLSWYCSAGALGEDRVAGAAGAASRGESRGDEGVRRAEVPRARVQRLSARLGSPRHSLQRFDCQPTSKARIEDLRKSYPH